MKIKLYCLLVPLITLLLQSACSKHDSLERNDLSAQLVPLFRTLYMGEHGKLYPHSEKILELCKTTNDKKCLEVYEKVKETKQKLIALKSQETLNTTFNVIIDSCESPNENIANFDCYGALMSFYFYPEAEYDKAILEFVGNLSPKMQALIFDQHFDWFANRANPVLWTDYLKDAPVTWKTDNSKEITMGYFGDSRDVSFWTKD